MTDPVLVEVLRGAVVESEHRGAAVVVDADGRTVFERGDVDRPIFPRSAVKAFQALPLFETGAADRFGLTPAEIALAVASHSGEPEHAETARGMLAKAGLSPDRLECGAHWPMGAAATRDLAASGGKPTALHNNCSGKHAGFLCVACAIDEDPTGYVKPDHKVQREVAAALESMTGAKLDPSLRGVDGCSIPTYAMPLRAIAAGFARFGTGRGMGPERVRAAARIRAAAAAHPFMVAGSKRFDTELMEVLGERAFVKTGAEGVYCAALPEVGLGVAIKCDDGAGRAAEAVMAAMIRRFLSLSDVEAETVGRLGAPVIENWNGIEVGRIRPVAGL